MLSREDIELVLQLHQLYLPEDTERSVTVYLTTIKAQKFDIVPDHVIDRGAGLHMLDCFNLVAHPVGSPLPETRPNSCNKIPPVSI